MYAMNDPRYKYRPHSPERRAALSRTQRTRLGIPPGHSRVYGVDVPDEHVETIRERAATIARKQSYAEAQKYVLRAQENGWRFRNNAWSGNDLAELRRRWSAGETGAQIAKALGRSRSAILGKAHHLGLRRAPKGCREVPVAMIRPMIAANLGMDEPDDRAPEFRTSMLLVAPMFVSWSPDEMARWTGYEHSEASKVIRVMTKNGIWKHGKPDLDRYMEGDGKPGLQLGDVSLVLDTLLCLGQIRCEYGGERWSKP